ncbi:hypothetical protein KIW84_010409 [Lathyrus oleraceus]|uniref:F-box domain-containing protein n=1 Tax=Pisum sativum TaxID=3888 RepID=A0A9D4YM62_PEA|nr:hypothetical protein KIW84_010409 [Pisum sativum]
MCKGSDFELHPIITHDAYLSCKAACETLPEELISEVLSLLKVKSLLRFKCVNKSWNSLISDPFFVKMHLIKSSPNPHILLSSTYFSSTCNVGIHNPFTLRSLPENRSINLFPEVSKYKLMEKRCHIIGSCNGLTCLVISPSSRGGLSPKEVRVFNIGDNVWRHVQSFAMEPYRYSYTYNQLKAGVYLKLNNSLNWFALRDNTRPYYYALQQFVIISLDLGTETYTHFSFPKGFEESVIRPIVCVLMECLCVSHYSKGFDFVIWQMKEFGVGESWMKLLKFDSHGVVNMLPLHVFENGDTMIFASSPNEITCYNSTENRLF